MMHAPAALDDDFKDVRCPHCESGDLKLISLFGSSVSEVMFRCLSCRTFFNWIKWQGRLPASPALEIAETISEKPEPKTTGA